MIIISKISKCADVKDVRNAKIKLTKTYSRTKAGCSSCCDELLLSVAAFLGAVPCLE